MAKAKQGERIGAFIGASNGVVRWLGFGVHAGDEVPPDTGPNSMTGMLAEAGIANPKLVLDDGRTVWGCECWWGSEEGVKEKLAAWEADGWKVEPGDLVAYRGNEATDAAR